MEQFVELLKAADLEPDALALDRAVTASHVLNCIVQDSQLLLEQMKYQACVELDERWRSVYGESFFGGSSHSEMCVDEIEETVADAAIGAFFNASDLAHLLPDNEQPSMDLSVPAAAILRDVSDEECLAMAAQRGTDLHHVEELLWEPWLMHVKSLDVAGESAIAINCADTRTNPLIRRNKKKALKSSQEMSEQNRICGGFCTLEGRQLYVDQVIMDVMEEAPSLRFLAEKDHFVKDPTDDLVCEDGIVYSASDLLSATDRTLLTDANR